MEEMLLVIAVLIIAGYLLTSWGHQEQIKIIRENNNILRALLKKPGVTEEEVAKVLKGDK